MTNKEAIEQLKIIKESLMNCGGCEGARQSLTCIHLAIKALEENERLCLLYSDMANEMARLKSMTGER